MSPAWTAFAVFAAVFAASAVVVAAYSRPDRPAGDEPAEPAPAAQTPAPVELDYEHVGTLDDSATGAWLTQLKAVEAVLGPEPEPPGEGTDEWWAAQLADDGPLAGQLDAAVRRMHRRINHDLRRKLGRKSAARWTALERDPHTTLGASCASCEWCEFRRIVSTTAEWPVVDDIDTSQPELVLTGRRT